MPKERLPEGTYIELVRSLFATLSTTLIMAASFVGVGVLVIAESGDNVLAFLTVLGAAAALGRIFVLIGYRQTARQEDLTAYAALKMERAFAISYLLFAVIFGAFSARAFEYTSPDTHAVIIGLLFGYAAGVAVNLSYRPWISVTAIILAVLPTILVTVTSLNLTHFWVSLLLTVFLSGAIQSMFARYRFASEGITMSRKFAMLARVDPLTGLPNRLALAEQFAVAANKRGILAVHCLDLDKFKPVNDHYGHPIGDMLLQGVSERLRAVLRRNDFMARIGGDEFVVVQTDIADPSEAEMLARRIVRSLAQPYAIEGQVIKVGTSIGYKISSAPHLDLDTLMKLADTALLAAKLSGGGVSGADNRNIEEVHLAS